VFVKLRESKEQPSTSTVISVSWHDSTTQLALVLPILLPILLRVILELLLGKSYFILQYIVMHMMKRTVCMHARNMGMPAGTAYTLHYTI
jgi:hypothetical protein